MRSTRSTPAPGQSGHHRAIIADPRCDRGNAKLQYLFVNGRWFRDRSLAHALQEAYRGLLMSGRYAIGFLFLRVPPDKVDVNVHPTKAEVRFQENSLIYSLVRSAVKTRLLRENLVPRLSAPVGEDWEASAAGADAGRSTARDAAAIFGARRMLSPRRDAAEQSIAPWDLPDRGTAIASAYPPAVLARETVRSPSPLPSGEPFAPTPEPGIPAVATTSTVVHEPPIPSLTAVFAAAKSAMQIQDSYLVLETPDGMLVIDQHALHERILFEQLRRRVREGKLEVQRLLIPEPIDLPAEQAALVLEAADALRELGLEVSEFGGNTVLLSSYPDAVGTQVAARNLRGSRRPSRQSGTAPKPRRHAPPVDGDHGLQGGGEGRRPA